ncbi:hypothetical protein TRAPUB_751 [Trametes pubescens]|uniref:Uncharacterized protein n=1 Tax=Trametes pubescens TaxID=154538 RepID=A0A1M2VL49_TRAPU|nr:hypothetical protein TRAPUB_751 [Trametes pubescens]
MDQDGIQPCDEELPKDDTSQNSKVNVPTAHHYGTRTSTKKSRPGFKAGLAKRTREDINAETASKKAAASAVQAQKAADQAARRAVLDKKKDAVAVLENRRAAEEVLEADYFAMAPKLGYSADSPQDEALRNASEAHSPTPDNGHLDNGMQQDEHAGVSTHTLGDEHQVSQHASNLGFPTFLLSILVKTSSSAANRTYQSKAFSALADEYSYSNTEADGAQAGEDAHDYTQDGWFSNGQPVTETVESTFYESDGYQEEAHTEENEDEDDVIEIEDDVDDELLGTRGKPKKPSAAQVKAHKRQDIHKDLVLRRVTLNTHPENHPIPQTSRDRRVMLHVPSTSSSTLDQAPRSKAHAPQLPAAPKNAQASASTSQDTFNSTWRKCLQGPSQSSPLLSHMPQKSGMPTGAPRSHSATKSGPNRRKINTEDRGSDDEVIGGFTDQDVHVDPARAIAYRKSSKGPKALHVYDLSESEEPVARGQKRKSVPTASKSNAHRSKKSKKGSAASDGESVDLKAYDALPSWVKPEIKTTIIPSVLEYIGVQDNPWTLDTEDYTFRDLLQMLFDGVFPQHQYDLEVDVDSVYGWCKQQAYDWRHNFQKHANTAVQHERDARLADEALSDAERSAHGIRIWLTQATTTGGEAMWGEPDIRTPRNARKQLHSKYILQVLADHLQGTVGSIMQNDQYPVGALALAITAVQRAFEWYLHDHPKGIKQEPFSVRNIGGLTAHWRNTAVADLLKMPHRFEQLLESATSQINVSPAKTKPCRSQLAAAVMYTRERSSSPAPH